MTYILDTQDGYVVVDKALKPVLGDTIYFEAWDKHQIGRLKKHAIICEDGDTIEGEPLDEVTVIGVVTWVLTRARGNDGPTI